MRCQARVKFFPFKAVMMTWIKSDSRLAYSLYRGLWNGLDLLFPPICGGCGKPGARWCLDCQGNVEILNGSICDVCGLPLKQAGMCDTCLSERPLFRSLRSWAVFEDPVRNALHRLKYKRDIGLGEALAAQLVEFVRGLHWPIDIIVPIPLGKKRLQERGYNQVGMIARPLSLALGIKYAPGALYRQRETRSQVGLTKIERRDNVRDVFQATGGMLDRKTILVMDDVATTGSTLSSSAEALLSSGAKEVYALTVARALAHHMSYA
jgi:competence protein ComFC